MKLIKQATISSVFSCLLIPFTVQAGSFEDAMKEATASIDRAKAVNYEWRDSRKLLKQADKLNKEGNSDKAMQLVEQARKQGELAVAQAEQQSSVTGPY